MVGAVTANATVQALAAAKPTSPFAFMCFPGVLLGFHAERKALRRVLFHLGLQAARDHYLFEERDRFGPLSDHPDEVVLAIGNLKRREALAVLDIDLRAVVDQELEDLVRPAAHRA